MSPSAKSAVAIEGGRPLQGRVRVPGDKSISHRALIVGALADGTSSVSGLSDGDDVARTLGAVRALGAEVVAGEGDGVVRIHGGAGSLHEPASPLDFGNSGTGIRLMAGVVASFDGWSVRLGGDDSLSKRPMDRIALPLRTMGADVAGRGELCLPPLDVRGRRLSGIDYTPPVASAQVKSCILLAALAAQGSTTVREPILTRVHTEELLARAGAEISEAEEQGAHVVRVAPGKLEPFELEVPADPSQAAFWLVGALLVPGSEVVVERVYTGPARRGFLDVLRRMGAHIEEKPAVSASDLASTSDLVARPSSLVATEVHAHEIPSLDEVPVLAVAAARAEGTTVFRDMGELRVKESDRFTGVIDLVRAFGGGAEAEGDDIHVTGVAALDAGDFDSRDDHRLAMAAAIAAASVPGRPTRILGWDSVQTSYPSFRSDLATLSGEG